MDKTNIDLIKHLEEIKDQKSNIEMRLFDNKHGNVAYKTLTYRELMIIVAGTEIEWHKFNKEDKQ